MEQESKEILNERFRQLPITIQALIKKPTLRSSIRIIGEKHHLPEEKIAELENTVILVLLAFYTKQNFEEQVIEELLIPGSVAASIARDIDSTIFSEVREELEAICAEREQYEKEQGHQEYVRDTSPAYQEVRAPELQGISVGYQPAPVAEPAPAQLAATPSYTQHLTSTPRYDSDPYREKAD